MTQEWPSVGPGCLTAAALLFLSAVVCGLLWVRKAFAALAGTETNRTMMRLEGPKLHRATVSGQCTLVSLMVPSSCTQLAWTTG